MLSAPLRVSRTSLLRAARCQPALTARRTLITPTAIRQADLVQDLYLRELKSYKVPTVKATDSEGHVQKFAVPKAPASPEETNIANELKEYETQQVEVEGASTEPGAAPVEEDWFEEDVEEPETAHH